MQTIKPLDPSDIQVLVNKFSPFLIEVRKKLIHTLIFFVVSALAGFLFYETIIKFLITALGLQDVNLVFTSPFQFINLALSCGLTLGLIVTFPLLIFQILSFLKPALRAKEFRLVTRLLPISLFLFALGFVFGTMVMKWQIVFFLSKSDSLGIGNLLDVSRLLSTILIASALMGISFQFPLILQLLLRLGVVKRHQLAKARLWIYVGSFIFAILLPLDSILADFILALPLIFLFELSLLLYRKK